MIWLLWRSTDYLGFLLMVCSDSWIVVLCNLLNLKGFHYFFKCLFQHYIPSGIPTTWALGIVLLPHRSFKLCSFFFFFPISKFLLICDNFYWSISGSLTFSLIPLFSCWVLPVSFFFNFSYYGFEFIWFFTCSISLLSSSTSADI